MDPIDPHSLPVHFAPARGGRIAYQIFGDGPVTIVAIPPSAQNIEAGWEWSPIARMLERFASFSRYVHFDKRGTGSSDRTSLVPGIDERVDDLRAVMDHAGIERAHLFAQSEGGPMTLLFAATYPDRVESITLHGSGARMAPYELTADERAAVIERQADFISRWGTPSSTTVDLFAPSLAGDDSFRQWHQRYERVAATADSLTDLFAQILDMDVREVVPDIAVPILVIHRKGDERVPVELGREVVELAPNAELIELDGVDHFGYVGDLAEWMTPVERFITGTVQERPLDSVQRRSSVAITTLGRFAVTVDGEEVATSDWGSRRARILLKRLVVARGWPVTRDELFDLLWPDETNTGKLGARLSVQLSAVRRVLGGGVVADRQTVALDLDHVAVDTEALLNAATAGDDAAVVDAYQGEFLPGERYDDWSAPLRDDVRSAFVVAARRLLDDATAGGDHALAASLARRLIAVDPYADDAHRHLIDALTAIGDQPGVDAAGAARQAVLDELGL